MKYLGTISHPVKFIEIAKYFVAVAIALAGGGFAAAVYLGSLAKASEMKEIRDTVSVHASNISVLTRQSEHAEEDLHWLRDQVIVLSRSLGAPVVPYPKK